MYIFVGIYIIIARTSVKTNECCDERFWLDLNTRVKTVKWLCLYVLFQWEPGLPLPKFLLLIVDAEVTGVKATSFFKSKAWLSLPFLVRTS